MTAIPLAMLPPEVQDAIARGERVDILDAGRKVAEVAPGVDTTYLPPSEGPVVLGSLRGLGVVPADFDAPMEDFAEYM